MDDLNVQNDEIVLLKSMYSDNELLFSSASVSSSIAPICSFTLKMKLSNTIIADVDFDLPSDYPSKSHMNVFIRCPVLLENEINRTLQSFLHCKGFGVPIVFDVINWIGESYSKFLHSNCDRDETKSDKKFTVIYARLWIYSHHIYSTIKRRKILSNARQLSLRGFSVPGKPGFIVVEGDEQNCEAFYTEIRSWNWQKLQLKLKEDSLNKFNGKTVSEKEIEAEFSRLSNFCELALSISGDKSGNDLRHYLQELGFEEIFHQIFL